MVFVIRSETGIVWSSVCEIRWDRLLWRWQDGQKYNFGDSAAFQLEWYILLRKEAGVAVTQEDYKTNYCDSIRPTQSDGVANVEFAFDLPLQVLIGQVCM